ncbi:MAG: MFS family permease [Planctomycetaceae bacterium]|jgi:MFS family permease
MATAICDVLPFEGSVDGEYSGHRRESTTRRDLKAITSDGIAQSVMVGLGETWLPAFALALGMGEMVSGLMATVPMLAGSVLQLVSPRGVQWCGSLRRWVVLCAILQAISFVPLAFAAAVGSIPVVALFAVAAIYWGAGLGTGAAWNAWVETLVPAQIRPKFFACRTRLAQLGVLAGLIGGGLILEYGRASGAELWSFGAIFVVAGLARLWSSRVLASQSEPVQKQPTTTRTVTVNHAASSLPRVSQRRLIAYLLGMQGAVFVAGPFFSAWMLKYLQMTYLEFVVLIAASFAAKAVVLPRLGTVAQKWGASRLLWLGAIGIVPLPAMWLVSNNLVWLLFVQILGGVAWAAHELAMLLLFFDSIPREDRTRVLSVYNFANAAAMCVGTAIGAVALQYFGENAETYLLLFAASSAARLLPLVQLVNLPRRVATSMPLTLRLLAVRPSAGSFERPVFGTAVNENSQTQSQAGHGPDDQQVTASAVV